MTERLNEQKLDRQLSMPSERLIQEFGRLRGDILVLGAGGKMGPSLALLAQNAIKTAGGKGRVIAVSRFSDLSAQKLLADGGVEMIGGDLLEKGFLEGLPDCENIIYMAGRKFGTAGCEYLTWAMNAWLPVKVCEKYNNSRIVVFSSGNIYPFTPVDSKGAGETMSPDPRGEYAMSCLARERMFEYASVTYSIPVTIFRLNYAVDLRYGVLCDIAQKILRREPVPLSMTAFNCIWQGDANERALRCLTITETPPKIINVTGREKVFIREAAEKLGVYLGVSPVFEGTESDTALLANADRAAALFGEPQVSVDRMIRLQAEWILDGGRSYHKPTHFEERGGKY